MTKEIVMNKTHSYCTTNIDSRPCWRRNKKQRKGTVNQFSEEAAMAEVNYFLDCTHVGVSA
jgi:hypothetical protein